MDDEDEEDSGATYPKVDVTLRFTNSRGEPIEDLRVDLDSGWGFVGEDRTDSDGEVQFEVRSWTTYTIWVEHSSFEDLGVSGGDETFDFTYDDGTDADDDDEVETD